MQFVDEVSIEVRGGHGGAGCVAFRRERRVPLGGPNGGNGGAGGSVYLKADAQLHTLYDIVHAKVFQAPRGANGKGDDRTGRSGEDRVIRVPVGTIVKDPESGQAIKDLVSDGETLLVARGGRGGLGNAAFVSSVNRSPRKSQPGEDGEKRRLRLELKLLAEVGIIGLPNAGKSTLLSVISAARPKIADYPFTTKEPNLGIVELSPHRTSVFADLPGLVEGAHAGRGLGHRFLRHVERTKILLHLVDVGAGEDPALAYATIRRELGRYSPALAARPEIVAATKMDLTDAEGRLKAFRRGLKKAKVLPVSSATRKGLKELLSAVLATLDGGGDR